MCTAIRAYIAPACSMKPAKRQFFKSLIRSPIYFKGQFSVQKLNKLFTGRSYLVSIDSDLLFV